MKSSAKTKKRSAFPSGPWVLFDVSNLCWQSFHAVGDTLDRDGSGVGAIYVALKSAIAVLRTTGATNAIWCFDSHGGSVREAAFPSYKKTRKEVSRAEEMQDPELSARRKVLYKQIDRLFSSLESNGMLPFKADRYEADDLLASSCHVLQRNTQSDIYICTTDTDLYQCLTPQVSVVRTAVASGNATAYTQDKLLHEFGIRPDQWALVKAIAGCKTDDVPGVAGVGNATAAKYVAGNLPAHHKTYAAIKNDADLWAERLPLVTLPWEGTPEPEVSRGEAVVDKLPKLFKEWGFVWAG